MASLIERFGSWPVTRQAESPSGSRHYYFRWPKNGEDVRNSTGTLGPGIDVRGNGGMVVAPPSVRNGASYRWVNDALICNAPQWLLALVVRRPTPPSLYQTTDNTEIVYGALVKETMKYVPTELKWRERNKIGMAIRLARRSRDLGRMACAFWKIFA